MLLGIPVLREIRKVIGSNWGGPTGMKEETESWKNAGPDKRGRDREFSKTSVKGAEPEGGVSQKEWSSSGGGSNGSMESKGQIYGPQRQGSLKEGGKTRTSAQEVSRGG